MKYVLYYYSHFTDEATEAQSGVATCSRPQSLQWVVEPGSELGYLSPEPECLTTTSSWGVCHTVPRYHSGPTANLCAGWNAVR